MEGKWGSKDVGLALLFDRLVDERPFEPRETSPQRGYSREGLFASIQRELVRILNTRCAESGDIALTRERTILDFGLPDLDNGGRTIIRESDKVRISKLIRTTIEAFEPRLKGVEVEVIKLPSPGSKLLISIEGTVLVDQIMEPLSFVLPVGRGPDTEENGR